MTTTKRIGLPYIAAAQAQKHVTHNEALERLDLLVDLTVAGFGADTPPSSPAEGETHAIGPNPSGAWAGHAGELASFADGDWHFATVPPGWRGRVASTAAAIRFDGVHWVAAEDVFGSVGINTPAGGGDRLAVRSATSLFTHDGQDHRLKINKAAPSATGSIVFQDAWSGRAEFGLCGDDTLKVKVSADGALWRSAMAVAADGRIGIGTDAPQTAVEVVGTPPGRIADVTASNYGTGSGGVFHGQYAAGTPAAPLPAPAGTLIAGFGGRAWHGGGAFQPHSAAAIHCLATESPTASAWGAALAFLTTPTGSTTRRMAAAVTPNGTLWSVDASSWSLTSAQQTKPSADVQILASASAASGAASCAVGVAGYSLTSVGFRGFSARGTAQLPLPSVADDMLCFMGGHGHDGAAFTGGTKALIAFKAGEAWTAAAQGTYVTFETTGNGATTRQERMRLTGDGNLGIAVASPTARLHVNGAIRFGSFAKASLPSASASGAGAMIHVPDEAGGSVMAFSDGTAWRRVTDRNVVS